MQNYDFDCGRQHDSFITRQDEMVSDLLNEFERLLKGRQLEVFHLMRQGATNEQISLILNIDQITVRQHTKRFRDNLRKRFKDFDLTQHTMADYLRGSVYAEC
jgi:ATP/maltotriose-dependent transcriptional regulator MalT